MRQLKACVTACAEALTQPPLSALRAAKETLSRVMTGRKNFRVLGKELMNIAGPLPMLSMPNRIWLPWRKRLKHMPTTKARENKNVLKSVDRSSILFICICSLSASTLSTPTPASTTKLVALSFVCLVLELLTVG